MVYLMGGFDGEMELERSKVYIAGRTTKEALARIKGTGKVFLEQSDLSAGEHKIGGLTVTVAGDANQLPVQRAATVNNLKNLAIALLNYQSASKKFPTRATFNADGKPLLSWRVLVLPFLGQEEEKLFEEFHLDEPWDSDHNRKLIARMPAVFKNPRIDKPGMTNYLAVVGKECMFDVDGKPVQFRRHGRHGEHDRAGGGGCGSGRRMDEAARLGVRPCASDGGPRRTVAQWLVGRMGGWPHHDGLQPEVAGPVGIQFTHAAERRRT